MSEWSSYETDKALTDAWRAYISIPLEPIEEGAKDYMKKRVGKAATEFVSDKAPELAGAAAKLFGADEESDDEPEPEEEEEEEAPAAASGPVDAAATRAALSAPERRGPGRIKGTAKVSGRGYRGDDSKGEEEGILDSVTGAIANYAAEAREFANSDAGRALEASLAAASLIPGIGSGVAVADAIYQVAQGDYDEAGLALLGLVPMGAVLGKAGKAAPFIKGLMNAGRAHHKMKQQGKAADFASETINKLLPEGVDLGVLGDGAAQIVKIYDMAVKVPALGKIIQDKGGPFTSFIDGLRAISKTADQAQAMKKQAAECQRWQTIAGINARVL